MRARRFFLRRRFKGSLNIVFPLRRRHGKLQQRIARAARTRDVFAHFILLQLQQIIINQMACHGRGVHAPACVFQNHGNGDLRLVHRRKGDKPSVVAVLHAQRGGIIAFALRDLQPMV